MAHASTRLLELSTTNAVEPDTAMPMYLLPPPLGRVMEHDDSVLPLTVHVRTSLLFARNIVLPYKAMPRTALIRVSVESVGVGLHDVRAAGVPETVHPITFMVV